MKKLFLILVVIISLLTSCTDDNQVQVMDLSDGDVNNVQNNVELDVKTGDTIVVVHYLTTMNQYVYGKYIGVIPRSHITDITYYKAVVTKP